MALTYDTKLRIPATALSTTTGAPNANYTCGANAGVLVVMICWATQTARTGGSPTYNGVALTQAQSRQGVTETSVEMWYMLGPPTGSAYAVNVPNDGGLTMWVYVASATTAAGSTCALDSSGVNATTAANPYVSVTTVASPTILFAVVATGDQTFAPSARTGNSLYEEDIAAYGSAAQYYNKSDTGAQTLSWTDATSDDYGAIGAAFKEIPATLAVSVTDKTGAKDVPTVFTIETRTINVTDKAGAKDVPTVSTAQTTLSIEFGIIASSSKTFDTGDDAFLCICEDANYIYISGYSDPIKVYRLSKSDFTTYNEVSMSSGHGPFATAIAQDADYVYVSYNGTSYGIARIAKSDWSTITYLDSAYSYIRGICVDDTYVYSVHSGNYLARTTKSSFDSYTYKFITGGGTGTIGINQLCQDDTYLYSMSWENPTIAFRLLKSDFDTITLKTLTGFPSVSSAYSICEDANYVYFGTDSVDEIARLLKSDFSTFNILDLGGYGASKGLVEDGSYVYVVTVGTPNQVHRVKKSDFTVLGVTACPSGCETAKSATKLGYDVFIACDTAPGVVGKVSFPVVAEKVGCKDVVQVSVGPLNVNVTDKVGAKDIPAAAVPAQTTLYIDESKSTETLKTFDVGDNELQGIYEDSTHVYCCSALNPNSKIYKVNKSDLTYTELELTGKVYSSAICGNSTHIYVAYYGGVAKVLKSDFATVNYLATSGENRCICLDDNYIYQVEYSNPAKLIRILISDFSTINTKSLTTDTHQNARGVAQDANYVYTVCYMTPSVAIRLSKADWDTFNAKTLNTNIRYEVQQDANYVYFGGYNATNSELERIAKSDWDTLQIFDMGEGGRPVTCCIEGSYVYVITPNQKISKVRRDDFSTYEKYTLTTGYTGEAAYQASKIGTYLYVTDGGQDPGTLTKILFQPVQEAIGVKEVVQVSVESAPEPPREVNITDKVGAKDSPAASVSAQPDRSVSVTDKSGAKDVPTVQPVAQAARTINVTDKAGAKDSPTVLVPAQPARSISVTDKVGARDFPALAVRIGASVVDKAGAKDVPEVSVPAQPVRSISVTDKAGIKEATTAIITTDPRTVNVTDKVGVKDSAAATIPRLINVIDKAGVKDIPAVFVPSQPARSVSVIDKAGFKDIPAAYTVAILAISVADKVGVKEGAPTVAIVTPSVQDGYDYDYTYRYK